MKKKLTKLSNGKSDYKWQFCSLGGVARVNITSGEDIAHLDELDQKLWTVLSCPVKGLELEERTLDLIDSDRDGKIRVEEVVDASQWLCKVLKDPNKILLGKDSVEFSEINTEAEDGAKLLEDAKQVRSIIGGEGEVVSLPELMEFLAHYDEDRQEELKSLLEDMKLESYPYGENSDDAVAAVNAIRDKMADYYMRCRFLQFHDDCAAALDVSAEKVAEISGLNFATCNEEISKYPISRPIATCVMPVNEGVNPAWQAAFGKVKALVLDVDLPGKESVSEKEWNDIVAKIDAYVAAKADKVKELEEGMADKVKAEHEAMAPLEKLLRLSRDFYRLLRNYVMMTDFYDTTLDAVFQAGKLYIDSRCLNLCMKVTDMAKHAEMAGLSGMYLLYCNCVSKTKHATMDIVAVLTDGDVDNLRVGKNAIFYDCSGQDWDAVVTKIIDNPISIRQAFWSPYKKFGNWITEKLNKSAAEKESKSFESLTAKADSASTTLATQVDNGGTPVAVEKSKKPPFDIAKFAGIFAAIGMAVGYIAGAAMGLGKAFFNHPITIVLFILLIFLCVSGPSVFLAWSKLRKRNLGPVLNANGWAVNAKILVNTRFGATLTDLASYPKIVLDDPYAKKSMPRWLRTLITILVILLIIFGILYFKGYFNRFDNMKALHYDETSVVYRAMDKVFGSVKAELVDAVSDVSETVAESAAEGATTGVETAATPAEEAAPAQ